MGREETYRCHIRRQVEEGRVEQCHVILEEIASLYVCLFARLH